MNIGFDCPMLPLGTDTAALRSGASFGSAMTATFRNSGGVKKTKLQ